MKKYIKWAFLFIFIISLVIIIFFINYQNDEESLDYVDDFSIVYNKRWFREGVSLYENEKLLSENFNLGDSRYLIFSSDYVEFCDNIGNNECQKYNYEIKENNIFINSEDYFVTNGTYEIIFDDKMLKLIRVTDNVKMVHHFTIPK